MNSGQSQNEAVGSTPNELGNECQKWFLLFANFHIEVFYVGCTNPKHVLHGLNPRKHLAIVVGVGDVGEHGIRIVIVFVCLYLLG